MTHRQRTAAGEKTLVPLQRYHKQRIDECPTTGNRVTSRTKRGNATRAREREMNEREKEKIAKTLPDTQIQTICAYVCEYVKQENMATTDSRMLNVRNK